MAEVNQRSKSYREKERFLKEIRNLSREGKRFCFILGSGASRNSGIPTGQDMMKDWRKMLRRMTDEDMRERCADAQIDWSVWERIKQNDYDYPSEDYFTLYDLCYSRNPEKGRDYLQCAMRNAEASPGYHHLAKLLSESDDNVVITTNFDLLTEYTFIRDYGGFLQVLDPDSALRMQSIPCHYPLIAKLHGTLMNNPENFSGAMRRLDPHWEQMLPVLFANYTPIVIGYGGGDRTLMDFMERCPWLDRVYWCSMKECESDTIEQFLEPQILRHLVPMGEGGFDGIMKEIADALLPDGGTQPEKRLNPQPPTPPGDNKLKKTVIRVLGIVAVIAAVLLFTWIKPRQTPPEPPSPSVLNKNELQALNNISEIEELVFEPTLANAPEGANDLSEAGDGSIKCWLKEKTLFIAGQGGVAAPESCNALFENWESLQTVTGAEYFITDSVTDMSWMFHGCKNLETLDISKWDVSKVNNMERMFFGCKNLKELDFNDKELNPSVRKKEMFKDTNLEDQSSSK